MSHFLNVRSIVGARSSRIALGLLLVGLGVWAVLPYFSYRLSSSAFVNAEVKRIQAPISGYLAADLPRKGNFVDKTSSITLIRSYSDDHRRLVDLEGQQASAQARAALAKKQLEEVSGLDSELGRRLEAYRKGMIARLGYEIQEAEAEKVGCLAEVEQRRDIVNRMRGLAETGATSQIRSAEALAKQEATATQCEMAGARGERLRTELSSMQAGVYLRDGANDVPYTQQQRERLFIRRQELEMEARRNDDSVSQLAAEIVEERRRISELAQFNLDLPMRHVVWSVPATPGSVVTEGQTIIDFADCDNRFVTVELPEREFEEIKPGDPASVRLFGSDQWKIGRVVQVRGSAARGDDRLLAAQVPTPSRGNVTVDVSLPDEDARPARTRYCDIGRLADVRFHRSSPALIETVSGFGQWLVELVKPTEKLASQ